MNPRNMLLWLGMAAPLVLAGCQTPKGHATAGATSRPYLPHEVSLSLSLDATNQAFLVRFTNITKRPITNRFPKSRFEGNFWVVTHGKALVKLYDAEYLNLLDNALWANPLVEMKPGAAIVFSVPLSRLVAMEPAAKDAPSDTVVVFCEVARSEVVSNAIWIREPRLIEALMKARSRTPESAPDASAIRP